MHRTDTQKKAKSQAGKEDVGDAEKKGTTKEAGEANTKEKKEAKKTATVAPEKAQEEKARREPAIFCLINKKVNSRQRFTSRSDADGAYRLLVSVGSDNNDLEVIEFMSESECLEGMKRWATKSTLFPNKSDGKMPTEKNTMETPSLPPSSGIEVASMPSSNNESVPLSSFARQMAMKAKCIEAVTFRHPDAAFVVHTWVFKDRGNHHWAHKPKDWEDMCMVGQQFPIFDGPESKKLLVLMNENRSAPIRADPMGSNEQAKITTNKGKFIGLFMTYGLIAPSASDGGIKGLIQNWIKACSDVRIQHACHQTIMSKMKSNLIHKEAAAKGPCWAALADAASNIQFTSRPHLNCQFMGEQCGIVAGVMFRLGGISRSLWPTSVRDFAHGTKN